MKRIKPLNIVLGIVGFTIGWFGVQALMPNNTGSNESFPTDMVQVTPETFVKLVRAEYPDPSKNFSDEVLVDQSVDVCDRLSQGVSYETVIEDFKVTMAVDSDFAEFFAVLSVGSRCPDLSEITIN